MLRKKRSPLMSCESTDTAICALSSTSAVNCQEQPISNITTNNNFFLPSIFSISSGFQLDIDPHKIRVVKGKSGGGGEGYGKIWMCGSETTLSSFELDVCGNARGQVCCSKPRQRKGNVDHS